MSSAPSESIPVCGSSTTAKSALPPSLTATSVIFWLSNPSLLTVIT